MRGLAVTGVVMLLLTGFRAQATEIYRWTDEQGVIHFSDTRPAEEIESESLTVNNANPPGYDPGEDPYSIRNQAERINETWSRLEAEREKRREKRRELAVQPAPDPYRPYDPWYDRARYPYYGPAYRPPPHLPGGQPVRPLPVIRRQVAAMDELGLSGPRPHSVNSGRHHARVENSANFLDAVRNPPPRPEPLTQ